MHKQNQMQFQYMRMKIEVKRENDVIENELDAKCEYEFFFAPKMLKMIYLQYKNTKADKKCIYLLRLEKRKKLC